MKASILLIVSKVFFSFRTIFWSSIFWNLCIDCNPSDRWQLSLYHSQNLFWATRQSAIVPFAPHHLSQHWGSAVAKRTGVTFPPCVPGSQPSVPCSLPSLLSGDCVPCPNMAVKALINLGEVLSRWAGTSVGSIGSGFAVLMERGKK